MAKRKRPLADLGTLAILIGMASRELVKCIAMEKWAEANDAVALIEEYVERFRYLFERAE
jgi:hypothetical protein